MAISGNSIHQIVKPELHEEYNNRGKPVFLSALEYHDRTSGLFKQGSQGTRMIALTSKCYCAEDYTENVKFSCKGISKKQCPMSWERYLEALNESINRASNTGFRLFGSGIVTYTQEKLCLSTYYNKRVVLPDGIHMNYLW